MQEASLPGCLLNEGQHLHNRQGSVNISACFYTFLILDYLIILGYNNSLRDGDVHSVCSACITQRQLC